MTTLEQIFGRYSFEGTITDKISAILDMNEEDIINKKVWKQDVDIINSTLLKWQEDSKKLYETQSIIKNDLHNLSESLQKSLKEKEQLQLKLEKIKTLKDSKITKETGGGGGRFLDCIKVSEIEEILNEDYGEKK